ncbi:hypothetical protein L1887_51749 [Cichorium endivia]|nr:hypothetical protein L1887_51749 [Cichorium endivia]
MRAKHSTSHCRRSMTSTALAPESKSWRPASGLCWRLTIETPAGCQERSNPRGGVRPEAGDVGGFFFDLVLVFNCILDLGSSWLLGCDRLRVVLRLRAQGMRAPWMLARVHREVLRHGILLVKAAPHSPIARASARSRIIEIDSRSVQASDPAIKPAFIGGCRRPPKPNFVKSSWGADLASLGLCRELCVERIFRTCLQQPLQLQCPSQRGAGPYGTDGMSRSRSPFAVLHSIRSLQHCNGRPSAIQSNENGVLGSGQGSRSHRKPRNSGWENVWLWIGAH